MKKLCALCLVLLLIGSTALGVVSAADRILGWVLYTDIIAEIDGKPIRSYNINWYTFIVIEDLAEYGFIVEWLPDSGRIVVREEHIADSSLYTTTYIPEKNTHLAGTQAMPYFETRITAWLGNHRVTGYNIGGLTCICMDDLADFCAEQYIWDANAKTLRLQTRTMGTNLISEPMVSVPTNEEPMTAISTKYNKPQYVLNVTGTEPILDLSEATIDWSKRGYGTVLSVDYINPNGQSDSCVCLKADIPSFIDLILTIPAEPNTKYIVYYDIRTEGSSVFTNLSVDRVFKKNSQITGPSGWNTVTREILTNGTGFLELAFLFGYENQMTTGTVYIDNLLIIREHIWGEGIILEKSASDSFGSISFKCLHENCGAIHSQLIPPVDNSFKTFSTSYNENGTRIVFAINGSNLLYYRLVLLDGLDEIRIDVGQEQLFIPVASGRPFSGFLSLESVTGFDNISISTHIRGEKTYINMFPDEPIILLTDDGYVIMPTSVMSKNLSLLMEYINPVWGKQMQISATLKALSNGIVGSETDDYRKLYLLHRWVVENIYYDYDNRELRDLDIKNDLVCLPDDVYRTRRAVCLGYAYLLAALIQAQDIPAILLSIYTPSTAFIGNTDDGILLGPEENHAQVMAYLTSESRWVIMDPTWDSGNKFENGQFTKNAIIGLYFDTSIELFSFNHWLIDYLIPY